MTDAFTLTFQPGGRPSSRRAARRDRSPRGHAGQHPHQRLLWWRRILRQVQGPDALRRERRRAERQDHPGRVGRRHPAGLSDSWCRATARCSSPRPPAWATRPFSIGKIGRGAPKGKLLTPVELEALVSGWRLDPVVKKLCLQLQPPSDGENLNDLARLKKALKDEYGLERVSVDSIWIRNMPGVLREQDWSVTATVVDTSYGYKVIDLVPGAHCGMDYSIVLDIGTTTVWGQLLDLNTGVTMAQASEYNHQISYGEDVISRIVHSQRPGGRERLQQAVVDTINGVVDESGGADRRRPRPDHAHGGRRQHHHDLSAGGHRSQVHPHGALRAAGGLHPPGPGHQPGPGYQRGPARPSLHVPQRGQLRGRRHRLGDRRLRHLRHREDHPLHRHRHQRRGGHRATKSG